MVFLQWGRPPFLLSVMTEWKHFSFFCDITNSCDTFQVPLFPNAVSVEHCNLIASMNSFRQMGNKARLVVDKLYVDGELYRGDYQQSGK